MDTAGVKKVAPLGIPCHMLTLATCHNLQFRCVL
jgi:hypothetical protein